MADLADFMPPVDINQQLLTRWGQAWLADLNTETGKSKSKNAFDRQQSINFASFIDRSFAEALAVMLGGIPVVETTNNSLVPPKEDCVEVGKIRIIGGIRPQNFDVAYRPDGPRVVFDSKTLNDSSSIRKNWQNMVNDLSTEAATVHTRFPYAIVVFVVVLPRPALADKQEADIIRTLERLGRRKDELDQPHQAEAISVVLWDPESGSVDSTTPARDSRLCIDRLPSIVYPHYVDRYAGLPPHGAS